MDRDHSLLTMMEATAIMQQHVSVILQAKAIEAEKMKRWVCFHVFDSSFSDKEDQVKQCIEFHEKVIEVIDGLTKLENGLARNLKVVLNRQEEGGFGGGAGGGFGNLFSQDGDSL